MPRFLIMPDPGAPATGDELSGVVIQAADAQRAAVRYARRRGTTGPVGNQPRDLLIFPFGPATKLRAGVAAWDTATPTAALVSDQVADLDA